MNIPQCFFEFETDAGSKMFVEGRGSIVRAGNVGTGGRWGARRVRAAVLGLESGRRPGRTAVPVQKGK